MNEMILIVIVIAIIVIVQFAVAKIKMPVSFYVKLISTAVLLILIWLFSKDGKLSVKVIMSAIVVSSIIKEYLAYLKYQKEKKGQ